MASITNAQATWICLAAFAVFLDSIPLVYPDGSSKLDLFIFAIDFISSAFGTGLMAVASFRFWVQWIKE
jgi:hypothetical protein